MKRVFTALWAVLVLILIVLVANDVSNEAMIKAYNNKKYEKNFLASLGFTQPYIAHYNQGNNYYQQGYYDLAIDEYNKALDFNPPGDMDCQVRINIALAMTLPIDKDQVTVDNLQDTLDILYEAEEVLCENGCAEMDDDDGHSKDAQQLKEDIDEFIAELGVPVQFIKRDEDGNPLAGAKLQVVDNAGNVMYEWESTEFPFIEKGFRIGETYTMQETEPPKGYSKAEDIVFTINKDGSVSYPNQEKQNNEVIMVDSKEKQSGGGGGGGGGSEPQPKPDNGESDPAPVDPMQQLQDNLDAQEEQGLKERNEWEPHEYEYYDGEPW